MGGEKLNFVKYRYFGWYPVTGQQELDLEPNFLARLRITIKKEKVSKRGHHLKKIKQTIRRGLHIVKKRRVGLGSSDQCKKTVKTLNYIEIMITN